MRLFLCTGLVLAIAAFAARHVLEAPAAPAVPDVQRRQTDVELARDADRIDGVVPNGTTLGALLASYDVLEPERHALVEAIEDAFDVRRVRAGRPFVIERLIDGRVRAFEYEIDGDRRLVARAGSEAPTDAVRGAIDLADRPAPASFDRALADPEFRAPGFQPPGLLRRAPIAPPAAGAEPSSSGEPGQDCCASAFVVWIEAIEKDIELAAVEGEISREQPSLTEALDEAGERLDLALSLADVFSGEIDFSSELQPGDRFRLVVERQSREGVHAGYGPILAAEFVASGRALHAYRFAAADGTPAYYDAEGRSLKRFFLKSPLKFEPRITSRFSNARRHPVLNYTRAHNGVDYSAPSGAPVVTVAPGVVTLAGWTGGGGRTVRVRHANGYESEYLHLSAITVRAGARVSQGDLVGRVGATGLATGPHLHYGLRKNGRYVNPVVEHRSMPPGDPVPAAELAVFTLERDRLFRLLSPARPRAAN